MWEGRRKREKEKIEGQGVCGTYAYPGTRAQLGKRLSNLAAAAAAPGLGTSSPADMSATGGRVTSIDHSRRPALVILVDAGLAGARRGRDHGRGNRVGGQVRGQARLAAAALVVVATEGFDGAVVVTHFEWGKYRNGAVVGCL